MTPADRAKHNAAQDVRNEVHRIERHERDIRRLTNERWQRRIAPLMNTAGMQSPDFDGCTE
jgi:hypothetical protein